VALTSVIIDVSLTAQWSEAGGERVPPTPLVFVRSTHSYGPALALKQTFGCVPISAVSRCSKLRRRIAEVSVEPAAGLRGPAKGQTRFDGFDDKILSLSPRVGRKIVRSLVLVDEM
jgi:hypothetical protein